MKKQKMGAENCNWPKQELDKNNTKNYYITLLLRVTITHTLTENVKRGRTAHTQYTSKKKKIATTNYTRTKNTWRKIKKNAIN